MDPRGSGVTHRSGRRRCPPALRGARGRVLTASGSALLASDDGAPRARPLVALLGNPNTGKTTLFNHLCGVRSKTANFPGTTTRSRLGLGRLGDQEVDVVDLPGVYRLGLSLPESVTCRAVLSGESGRRPDLVLVVLDATNLTRNLVLLGELRSAGVNAVAALNMVDLARRRGLSFDVETMARQVGCPVVPISARRGEGLQELRGVLVGRLALAKSAKPEAMAASALEQPLDDWAAAVVETSVGGRHGVGAQSDSLTERLDQAFTHPVLGGVVFAGVMIGLFWVLFSLASVPMSLIEATFGHLGSWIAGALPPGPVRDLLVDGVIGGIAGTLVFLPQICLLFFLLSLIEDTGYLARAAFVMDRVLSRFGLPGYAFVPLLSSHACAVPGILSTRLIPDRQDRLTTILVAPLMSCSARVPVYVFLTGLLFAGRPFLAGLAFSGCYVLGAVAALSTAAMARRTILRGPSRPMVLELPSYKLPSLSNALLAALDQGLSFLRTAGTVVMAICLVMWWLSSYPRSEPPGDAIALRAQAAALEAQPTASRQAVADLLLHAQRIEGRHRQEHSFIGRLGRLVQPVFAPLGYDWQLTVGVLSSFLAREVFVSTLSVLLEAPADAGAEDPGVLARIRAARRDDGSPLFSIATSASLLVFFVLALQCLSTLAVARRETGSWRWPALQFGFMSALAYLFAFGTYRGLLALGFS